MSTPKEASSTFQSRFDSEKIFFREWIVHSARGCLFLVHGLSEHSGRYSDFAIKLSESLNVSVYALDHRAHGLTACPRGKDDLKELGVFRTSKDKNKLNCIEVMGRDVIDLIDHVNSDRPFILLGHSMGSVIARWSLCHMTAELMSHLQGVVLSGVPTVPAHAERLPLLLLVNSAISMGKGQAAIHHFITDKLDSEVKKQTGNKKLERNCFISSVPEVLAEFKADPLSGQTVDLHIWRGMRASLIALQSVKSFFRNLDRRIPIMWISGRNDPVCRGGATAQSDAAKMASLGHHVSTITVGDCLHEFIHEKDNVRNEGISLTIAWMADKLSSTSRL